MVPRVVRVQQQEMFAAVMQYVETLIGLDAKG